MDIYQMFEALEDQTKKDRLLEYIATNKTVLRDELGETFETIKFGELTIPVGSFHGLGSHGLRDPKTVKMRNDDILQITYFKTGTHWVCNILHFLLYNGSPDEIVSREPDYLEITAGKDLESLESPRILSAHMTPDMLPDDAFNTGRKIIISFRNPKDTAVSLFHHYRTQTVVGSEMRISWNCYIDCWMKGEFVLCDYFEFYNIWQQFIQQRTDLEVLIVNYEDLITDGLKEIKRIQKYLGLEYGDDRLLQILDRCSNRRLKADVEEKKLHSPFVTKDGSSFLYRKGIIGDWKNHFTVAQNEKLEELAAKKFKNSIFKWKV